MFEIRKQALLALAVTSTIYAAASKPVCKASPGSGAWPSLSDWQSLNASISGRLLQPSAPGAVCHPDQPNYNKATCASVLSAWTNQTFHSDNPISVNYQNWNNDSCYPDPRAPCSEGGYPIYVVNASTAEHVQAGVNFARQHNVRLIVKGSGHDALGRSCAANSFSIWTRHIGGISFSSNFPPKGCSYRLNESSITVGAGVFMREIYQTTAARNLVVVGGMALDISIGGYYSGGGHSTLSPVHGLGADNVLEVEVVTPAGNIVTANDCQHSDLFWAMRGGGGSTFGAIASITLRTFKTPKIGAYTVALSVPDGYANGFWNTTTFLFQQMPKLVAAGIGGYLYGVPSSASHGGYALFGIFTGVNNSAKSIQAAVEPVITYATSILPLEVISFQANTTDYPSFWNYYQVTYDSWSVGSDIQLGSRLLNTDVLSVPFNKLKTSLIAFTGDTGFNAVLVAGKGVWDAKPRGGSNSVNPAWRNNTIVHLVTAADWPPLDSTARTAALASLEQQVGAMRELAPYSGAYINEADADEPNHQQTFWGSNYPRLQNIKKRLDPDDVFRCHPCVGGEGWKEEEAELCRV